jgi:hypothetical protein
MNAENIKFTSLNARELKNLGKRNQKPEEFMETKTIAPVIEMLDNLTSYCGHFTTKYPHNNRYGCLHKDVDDNHFFYKHKLDENGEIVEDEFEEVIDEENTDLTQKGIIEVGCCFSFTCPVAVESELEELMEEYPEHADGIKEEWENCSELMLIHDETILKSLEGTQDGTN